MKASIFFFIILLNSNALGDFSRGHAYEVYQERDLVEQRKAYKNAISLLRNSQFANFSKEKEKLKRSLGGISDMKKTPDIIFIIDTNT